jgi:hypothetical protein
LVSSIAPKVIANTRCQLAFFYFVSSCNHLSLA